MGITTPFTSGSWKVASNFQDKALGINFGTTKFPTAWLDRKKFDLVLTETGARKIPSLIAVTAHSRLTGH